MDDDDDCDWWSDRLIWYVYKQDKTAVEDGKTKVGGYMYGWNMLEARGSCRQLVIMGIGVLVLSACPEISFLLSSLSSSLC